MPTRALRYFSIFAVCLIGASPALIVLAAFILEGRFW
jgi:hypothetical protein